MSYAHIVSKPPVNTRPLTENRNIDIQYTHTSQQSPAVDFKHMLDNFKTDILSAIQTQNSITYALIQENSAKIYFIFKTLNLPWS